MDSPNSDPHSDPTKKQPSADQIKQLIRETCQHPKGSPQRQKGLTELVRLLTRQLWHTSAAYYPDALQQTWIYFCRNLCSATTGRAYDPDIATPVTWLNAYLKRRLQDFQIAENRDRATTLSASSFSPREDGLLDPIDRLPARPDIPPWLEQIKAWAESSRDLDKIHVSKHPTVTAKALILKRLPPETPWKTLSAEYGISVGTLSSFYQRQCLSKLRAYGKAQGYF
ncbi:MAG: sigma-70 family RNA polymerase sigma factor [Phormidesmis sp.]